MYIRTYNVYFCCFYYFLDNTGRNAAGVYNYILVRCTGQWLHYWSCCSCILQSTKTCCGIEFLWSESWPWSIFVTSGVCFVLMCLCVCLYVYILEMQQYIEILLYCNIFCCNTMQYGNLGYRYIVYCNMLLYIADNFNVKLTKLKHFFACFWLPSNTVWKSKNCYKTVVKYQYCNTAICYKAMHNMVLTRIVASLVLLHMYV